MDEFPPNSYAKRERPDQIKPAADVPEKRVEKVVEGKVIRRKKSLGKRLKEHFLGNDSASVGEYVLDSVLIPALKDMVADATRSGVEHFLFGSEDRRYGSRGRTTRSRGSREQRTDYARYSRMDDRPPFPPTDRRPTPNRRTRGSHNFDDIILATRVEGQEVIDRLYFLLEKYEVATVGDLYELLGLTSEYTDDSWGWTELRGATVRHTRDGYLLDLPRPEPLD